MMRAAPPFMLAFLLAACVATPSAEDAPRAAAPADTMGMAATAVAEGTPALEGDAWYRNGRYGFAIQLPPKLEAPGDCTLKKIPPKGFEVLAFEDGESVFLAPSVYGAMIEKVPGDPSAGFDCVRINNTLPTIRKNLTDESSYPYGWRLFAADRIANDADLLGFVRRVHGTDCSLGAKKPTSHEGTLDVEIRECPSAGVYRLKYAPERRAAVTWVMDGSRFDGLDDVMAGTMRFE